MTAAVTVNGAWDVRARRLGYRDAGSGHEVVVTTPSADPQLWQDYLAGAQRSYRLHGVEHALDFDQMQDGRSSSLLFVVLSSDGEVIGGIRSQGPYTSADQSHAIVEWEGAPGQAVVRAMIEQRLPEGVVEMKTAWVDGDQPARREVFTCLARTPIHAAMVLGARHVMGTAAVHSMAGWVAAGGVVADVPAVAYPDERYRTSLAWIDRTTLGASLGGRVRRALDEEVAQLLAPVLPAQEARQ